MIQRPRNMACCPQRAACLVTGPSSTTCLLPCVKFVFICRLFFQSTTKVKHTMSAIPLSKLSKGAVAHIDSIIPNSTFGELDPLVTRRLADLSFSSRRRHTRYIRDWSSDVCLPIYSIVPNSTFGELDPLVTRRLADLGFSRTTDRKSVV